jgi:hypothetical protein
MKGFMGFLHGLQVPVQLSHEAIYTALYAMPKRQLRSRALPCCAAPTEQRRSRAGRAARPFLDAMTLIDERPSEVAERPGARPLGRRPDQGKTQPVPRRHTGRTLHPLRRCGQARRWPRRNHSKRLRIYPQPLRQPDVALTDLRPGPRNGPTPLTQPAGKYHSLLCTSTQPWERGVNETPTDCSVNICQKDKISTSSHKNSSTTSP